MLHAEDALKITELASSAPNAVADIMLEQIVGAIRLHASFKKKSFRYEFPSGIESTLINISNRDLARSVGKKLQALGYYVKINRSHPILEISWETPKEKVNKLTVKVENSFLKE